MDNRIHSTGALYVTINNLPRELRFLRENIFLLCVLPGPTEPSKEQMNSVLDLLQKEVSKLQNGTCLLVAQVTVRLIHAARG